MTDAPDVKPVEGKPEKREASKSRYKTLAIILGAFAVIGLIGFFWWLHTSGFVETDDAYITGHVHQVSARVGGTVQKVLVEDNQLVTPGQLLVEIDPADYGVALSRAEHDLKVAAAQAGSAQAGIPLAEQQAAAQIAEARAAVGVSQSTVTQSRQAAQEAQAGIGAAQEVLREQEANYQRAQLDYQRYAGADPQAISAQQLDTARAALRVAEANRNAAQSQLTQASARAAQARTGITASAGRVGQSRGTFQGAQAQRLNVNVARNQYEAAKATIETSRDALKQAQLNMSYTKITAPVPGRIGRRSVEIGQSIQPGQPLMSVVDSKIWIVANFKETQLKKMRPGQPVTIKVDAYPDREFKGWVDSFAPASGAQFALLPPENATGNFTKTVQRIPVKIVFDTKSLEGFEDLLVPGLSVVPTVDVTAPVKKQVR